MENRKREIAKFYEQIFLDAKLKERLEEKVKKIANEEDLRKLIREEIMPLMKKFKVNFSEEALLEYEQETLKKLSKEALTNVSGGMSIKSALLTGGLLSMALLGGVSLSASAMDKEPPALPAMQGKQPQTQEISFSYLMYDAMDGSSALYNENAQADRSIGEIIEADSEDETIDGFIYNGTFVDPNTRVNSVVEDWDNILVVVRNAKGHQLDAAQIWAATEGERTPQTIQAFALNAETGEIEPTCLNRYPGELIANLFEDKINEKLGTVDTAIYNGESLDEGNYDEVRELNTSDNPPVLLIFKVSNGFDIDDAWNRFFTSLLRIPVLLSDLQNKTTELVGLWGIKDKPIADLEEFINDPVGHYYHDGTILDPRHTTFGDLNERFNQTGDSKVIISVNEPVDKIDIKKVAEENERFRKKTALAVAKREKEVSGEKTTFQGEIRRLKDLRETQRENQKKFFRNANKETTRQYLARIMGNAESTGGNPSKADTLLGPNPTGPSTEPLPILEFGHQIIKKSSTDNP